MHWVTNFQHVIISLQISFSSQRADEIPQGHSPDVNNSFLEQFFAGSRWQVAILHPCLPPRQFTASAVTERFLLKPTSATCLQREKVDSIHTFF
jgi:hypothetical protein